MSWGERSCRRYQMRNCKCNPTPQTCHAGCPGYVWDRKTEADIEKEPVIHTTCIVECVEGIMPVFRSATDEIPTPSAPVIERKLKE